MHTVELFTESIKEHHIELPCEPVKAVCAITGHETDCIPRKYVISDGFTNQTLLEAGDSPYMSVAAFQSLKFRPQRSSWVVVKNESETVFTPLKRAGVRDVLMNEFNGIDFWDGKTIWACYASTTGKKHGALYAPINSGRSAFFAKDAERINCTDTAEVIDWYSRLDRYLRLGIGRKVLESLDGNRFLIKKIGLKLWNEFYSWASDKYRSTLWKFLIFLLPSQAEIKEQIKEEVEKDGLGHEVVFPKEENVVSGSIECVEEIFEKRAKKNSKPGQMSLFG